MARRRGKRWVAEGYDRASRAKRYLGTFDSKKEARDAEAEWKLRSKATGREACDKFAARWVKDYPRDRASTNKHNGERVKAFARDFKGVRLSELDRPAARAWALTHRSHVPAVRAMFSDALRDGLVSENPFTNLRLPGSRGRKDIVALTETELLALADLTLDPRMELGEFAPQYRAMILFAGYVGLRPGELFALLRSDVHGQMATVERSLSSTGEIGLPKNGRARTVIVPPVAEDALLQVPAHSSGLLFTTATGKMWSQPSHFYYWSRLRLLANRPGFDFYELRSLRLRRCCWSVGLRRGMLLCSWGIRTGDA